jgi:hypothetical protein
LDQVAHLPSSSRYDEEGLREETDDYKLNRTETIGGFTSIVEVQRTSTDETSGSRLVVDKATNHSTNDEGVAIDSNFVVQVNLSSTNDWQSRTFNLSGVTKENDNQIVSRKMSRNTSKEEDDRISVRESDIVDVVVDDETNVRLETGWEEGVEVDGGKGNKTIKCATKAMETYSLGVCNQNINLEWSNGSRSDSSSGVQMENFKSDDREVIVTRLETTISHPNASKVNFLNISNNTRQTDDLVKQYAIYESISGLLANKSVVNDSSTKSLSKDASGKGSSVEKRKIKVESSGSVVYAFTSDWSEYFQDQNKNGTIKISTTDLEESSKSTETYDHNDLENGSWKSNSDINGQITRPGVFSKNQSSSTSIKFAKLPDLGHSLLENITTSYFTTSFETGSESSKSSDGESFEKIESSKKVKETEKKKLDDYSLLESNLTINNITKTSFTDGRLQTRNEDFRFFKLTNTENVESIKKTNNFSENTCQLNGVCTTTTRSIEIEDDGEGNSHTSRKLYSKQPISEGILEVNSTYQMKSSDEKTEQVDDMLLTKTNDDGSISTEKRFSNDTVVKTDTEEKNTSLLHNQAQLTGNQNDELLFSRNETVKNTINSISPKAFKESSVEESALVMNKDDTKRLTVIVNQSFVPEPEQALDTRSFNSSYLQTSLIADEEKPSDLVEYVLKNESSLTLHASGDFSSTQISHNESSETNKTTNLTREMHRVTKTYKNGSSLVMFRNVVGTLYLSNGSVITARNTSHQLFDDEGQQLDLKWTYTVTKVKDLDHSVLLESKSYPSSSSTSTYEGSDSDSSSDGVVVIPSFDLDEDSSASPEKSHKNNLFHMRDRRRVLEDADDGNYVLLNCFTGFGRPSMMEMKKIYELKPEMTLCIDFLNSDRPDFTLAKLRDAMKNK